MRGLYAIVDVTTLRARDVDVVAFAYAVLLARPCAMQLRAKDLPAREILALSGGSEQSGGHADRVSDALLWELRNTLRRRLVDSMEAQAAAAAAATGAVVKHDGGRASGDPVAQG